MLNSAKILLQRVTGVRIYRHSLPHGFDLFRDLNRVRNWSAPPETIFDIGAHVGATVAQFRQKYPLAMIHAFEPAAANRRVLTAAAGSDPRLRIHDLAVSDRDGTAALHLTDHSATHSLIERDASIASEQVTLVTLDSFCRRHDISHIGFCKIDTEGNDLAVLRGAAAMLLEQRIDFVQVETSFRHDVRYFAPIWDIDRLMSEMRFELFGLYEQQPCWTGRGSLLYTNAVYVRSTLVNDLPPW